MMGSSSKGTQTSFHSAQQKLKACLDGCSPKTKPWHPILPSTGAEEDGQGWVSKAGSWEEEGLAFAPVLGSESAPSQWDEGQRGCPGRGWITESPLGEGWITKHFAGSAARVSCSKQDKQHKASSPAGTPCLPSSPWVLMCCSHPCCLWYQIIRAITSATLSPFLPFP